MLSGMVACPVIVRDRTPLDNCRRCIAEPVLLSDDTAAIADCDASNGSSWSIARTLRRPTRFSSKVSIDMVIAFSSAKVMSPAIIPLPRSATNGIAVTVMNDGIASRMVFQSMFWLSETREAPMIIMTADVATRSMRLSTGATNMDSSHHMAVKSTVRPVRPPSAIPVALAALTTTGGVPMSGPSIESRPTDTYTPSVENCPCLSTPAPSPRVVSSRSSVAPVGSSSSGGARAVVSSWTMAYVTAYASRRSRQSSPTMLVYREGDARKAWEKSGRKKWISGTDRISRGQDLSTAQQTTADTSTVMHTPPDTL
eukprot:scaffold938_cov399-Prasinococcus_capsulatus_cf.AAC.4